MRDSSAGPVHIPQRVDTPPMMKGSVSAPRVLVADDDPVATGALAWLLREQGYEVTSITDRRRLIEALERARPDLLLIDFENFGADGEQKFSK